jgi:hypothetical protein
VRVVKYNKRKLGFAKAKEKEKDERTRFNKQNRPH